MEVLWRAQVPPLVGAIQEGHSALFRRVQGAH